MISVLSVTNSTTGAASSNPYPVNWKAQNFGIGLGCTVTGSKGIGYDIEHSFDDPKSGFTNWFKHASLTNKTISTDGSYAFPITAIRIAITAQSVSGGGVSVAIVQWE